PGAMYRGLRPSGPQQPSFVFESGEGAMSLVVYNTLSREKEPFVPLDPSHVRLYVCGPTVYDYVHIGNARPVVVFDVLYRLLKRRHPRVTYVRNITDIDDKIMVRAAENRETIGA